MQNSISLIYKGLRFVLNRIKYFFDFVFCNFIFYANKVDYKNFETKGLPKLMVARGGTFIIGSDFRMNNSMVSNPIGCVQPCMLFVDRGAVLTMGNNVQMSQTAIVCHERVTIGNHVKLGGGVCIYDTDFHSLDSESRKNSDTDFRNKLKKPVYIGDKVFIGAHSVILKGVTVGENSIIAAGSIVTKSIPSNEIWGGNPAKKIRSFI
ncbi:acyltransferase [Algibacter mikhailovii]|uniref:acyltransferase n=1 Tax=Algibacter mikhailovii TaxID=425498 RepID=UPI002495996A|nr:acyltransferase [Algibacter mikhailovii]